MRLPKFLFIASFLTFFSLIYVYQQTEILRLAYLGQKRLTIFEDLLDKNSILRYNLKRNTSLVHINNRLSDYTDYEMPQSFRLVRLASTKENIRLNVKGGAFNKENALSRLFRIKRQAEAKTINPQ